MGYTLDDAIKKYEVEIDTYNHIITNINIGLPNIYYSKNEVEKKIEFDTQLVEWLKELKSYKEKEECKNTQNTQ